MNVYKITIRAGRRLIRRSYTIAASQPQALYDAALMILLRGESATSVRAVLLW